MGAKHQNIAQLALAGSIHSYVQYGVGITYANNCLQHYWYTDASDDYYPHMRYEYTMLWSSVVTDAL